MTGLGAANTLAVLMSNRPAIVIIGPGRVGTALGVLAARAGWTVRAVAGRSLARARNAALLIAKETRTPISPRPDSVPPRRLRRSMASAAPAAGQNPSQAPQSLSARDAAQAARPGDILLLTVPDDAIARVCGDLVAAGAIRTGAIVAHCSGALGGDALAAAQRRGCAVGSLHPLQTFPNLDASIRAIPGSHFFIEGDPRAAAALLQLAKAVGGRPVRIAPEAKTLYHAAACVASNYLVALVDAALAIGEAAGIAPRKLLPALAPLLRATVENVLAFGPERALTGPIARGDTRTVARHLASLRRADPELARLYSALARRTEDLARRKRTAPRSGR